MTTDKKILIAVAYYLLAPGLATDGGSPVILRSAMKGQPETATASAGLGSGGGGRGGTKGASAKAASQQSEASPPPPDELAQLSSTIAQGTGAVNTLLASLARSQASKAAEESKALAEAAVLHDQMADAEDDPDERQRYKMQAKALREAAL
eukprot:3756957-Prymnesium_polylepis.1